MRCLLAFAALAAIGAMSRAARADVVEGFVVGTTARWTGDGSRIVTEATVRTADGREVVVSQLGGTVDGLTMRQFPGPEPLVLGMRVAADVREATDLEARVYNVVEGVRVLAMPADYVRTGPTKAGHYLYWESGCAFLSPDKNGSKEIPGDAELGVITACIDMWNTKIASCSYFEVKEDPPSDHEVGNDGINMIKFRETSWCRPAIKDDPARCYSPSAAGITTAVFVDDGKSSRDGAIVDADIELNGVDFAISNNGVTTAPAERCKADLANTLTHELGHFHGLEHTCLASGDPPRVDGDGNPVPSCGTTDPKITEATMYPFQDCGETKKASLEADDIAGVCAIYPIADDPKTCGRVSTDTGCCSASGTGSAQVLAFAGLGGLALAGSLRRRKK